MLLDTGIHHAAQFAGHELLTKHHIMVIAISTGRMLQVIKNEKCICIGTRIWIRDNYYWRFLRIVSICNCWMRRG